MRVILLRLLLLIGVVTAVAWAVGFPKPIMWSTHVGDERWLEIIVMDGGCAVLFLENAWPFGHPAFGWAIDSMREERRLLLDFGFKPSGARTYQGGGVSGAGAGSFRYGSYPLERWPTRCSRWSTLR